MHIETDGLRSRRDFLKTLARNTVFGILSTTAALLGLRRLRPGQQSALPQLLCRRCPKLPDCDYTGTYLARIAQNPENAAYCPELNENQNAAG